VVKARSSVFKHPLIVAKPKPNGPQVTVIEAPVARASGLYCELSEELTQQRARINLPNGI
jgi:hypothetical protein